MNKLIFITFPHRFFRRLEENDLKRIFEISCKKGLSDHLNILLRNEAKTVHTYITLDKSKKK